MTHMLCCSWATASRRRLSENDQQHEFGLENRLGRLDPAVECCRHPSDGGMPDLPLDVRDEVTGIGLVPAPVQSLGGQAELDERLPERSCGATSPRFSLHSRSRAASSLPIMIRASEPPMKYRLPPVVPSVGIIDISHIKNI